MNRARSVVTHCSHRGVFVFTNRAMVWWFSKMQNSAKPSTFLPSFLALWITVEQVKALQCWLRMFGVPVGGLANALCDNQGEGKNASIPESAFSKKIIAINCHLV
jgi:hypothetical protein